MNKVLEQAKKHFKHKLNGSLEKIHVEEWDQDIYYKNTYPFATESKIIELQQQGKTVEALVESIIAKSLDADGKNIFNKFDKNVLMYEVDPSVLLRIAGRLNSATAEYQPVDETVKN